MPVTQKQTLTITNREVLLVNGVTKVLGFDSDYVLMECESEKITVEGESLAIENLTKESGELRIIGKVTAVIFSNEKKERHGILSKFVK